jgi:heptosyltransferase-3
MGTRAAFFCHNGLGDGIVGLVLPNNLHLNGWHVDMYQNTIGSLQSWFPHLPVLPYPSIEELPRILHSYDYYFVVQNDTNPLILKLIEEGKRRFPERMKVIYLFPSKNIIHSPYYADCLTNPALPVSENLRLLCAHVLHLTKLTKSNGFIPPQDLVHRKDLKRIAIHPTSSKEGSNWPKEKFVELARSLQARGYHPFFIPGGQYIEQWQDVASLGLEVSLFPTLDSLARALYESGYFLGNDSGLGHLASSLNIPTLTFCRRKALAQLWAPSFGKGIVLTPSSLIPNIRGFRLRDRHWKKFITVGMAKRAFDKLLHAL